MKIKKILPALVLLFLISFLMVPVVDVAAVATPCTSITNSDDCGLRLDCSWDNNSCKTGAPTIITSGEELINKITVIGNWFFAILLAVAALILIWAGLDFVIGGGDEKKMTAARQKLIYALIGVAVAVAARGLVAAVRSIIGGS